MGLSYSFNLVSVDEVGSTNQVLFRASLEEYPLGTALLARRQTAGRGRADRTWLSPVGGMYLSVLFLPESVEGLTLLGALCVLRMCREDFGLPAVLRWPNDVYVEGRKLCGVLPQVKYCGQEVERVVLGVGLNVNTSFQDFPPEVRERATSLVELAPEVDWSIEKVAHRFLELFARELERFHSEGCAALAERCAGHLDGLGPEQRVAISRSGGELRELGRVGGLGPRGELLLEGGGFLDQLGVDERLVVY